MSLALLVWIGGGLFKRVLYFFGDEPSLGRKSLMLHLPQYSVIKDCSESTIGITLVFVFYIRDISIARSWYFHILLASLSLTWKSLSMVTSMMNVC